MAMPSDFAADILRNQSNLPTDILAQLILAYQKSIEVPEDDSVTNNVIYSPLFDLHNTFVELTDTPDISEDRINNHIGSAAYRKTIPETVHSDPLVYDFTNATGITFNQPDQNVGSRFNGAGIADSNSFIKINDNPILAITDEIIIVCYAFLKISTAVIGTLAHKGTSSFSLIRNASDAIVFAGQVAATPFSLSHTITSDGWYHIVATSKSGTQSLYVDKILEDSTTIPGPLSTDSNNVGIFAEQSGSNPLTTNEILAWLSIINGFADQSWVDDDFNGIRTLHDRDEVVCFPFMQNVKAQTPMTSGLFVSHP